MGWGERNLEIAIDYLQPGVSVRIGIQLIQLIRYYNTIKCICKNLHYIT